MRDHFISLARPFHLTPPGIWSKTLAPRARPFHLTEDQVFHRVIHAATPKRDHFISPQLSFPPDHSISMGARKRAHGEAMADIPIEWEWSERGYGGLSSRPETNSVGTHAQV